MRAVLSMQTVRCVQLSLTVELILAFLQESPWTQALLGPAREGPAHEDNRPPWKDRGCCQEALDIPRMLERAADHCKFRACGLCAVVLLSILYHQGWMSQDELSASSEGISRRL